MIPKGLPRGTQIVYRRHEPEKPEYGFIMREAPDHNCYWCRYWSQDLRTLRTAANSELTPREALELYDSVPEARVREALIVIELTG